MRFKWLGYCHLYSFLALVIPKIQDKRFKMILTKEYIMKYRTKKGAWTKKQLEALGIKWPPSKGWIKKLEGKEISVENAKIFEGAK